MARHVQPYLETKRRLRAALNRLGLDVTRVASRPFGEDVWLDVRRLAAVWNTPITTIFDVGANVGETAITLRARFPDARILAFEPHPETFRRLRESVAGTGIEAFGVALGHENRSADLFEYRFSTLNSLIEDAPYAVRFGENARRVPVSVQTLDDFCTKTRITQIDLLKIDTEGTDLDVLRGAETCLCERRVRFVQVEFNDVLASAGRRAGALVPICELLQPLGFRSIATYTEQVFPEGDVFVVATALFARRPEAADCRESAPPGRSGSLAG